MSVLLDAIGKPDSAAGQALKTATLAASDQTFKGALREAVFMRDRVAAWTAGDGGLARAAGELSAMLGLGAGDTAESIEEEFFKSTIIPLSQWPDLIAVLSMLGGSMQEVATALAENTRAVRELVEKSGAASPGLRAAKAGLMAQAAMRPARMSFFIRSILPGKGNPIMSGQAVEGRGRAR
jgi:hypothetical protein